MTKFDYGGIEFVRNAVRASENSPTKTRETEKISLCGDAIGHCPLRGRCPKRNTIVGKILKFATKPGGYSHVTTQSVYLQQSLSRQTSSNPVNFVLQVYASSCHMWIPSRSSNVKYFVNWFETTSLPKVTNTFIVTKRICPSDSVLIATFQSWLSDVENCLTHA